MLELRPQLSDRTRADAGYAGLLGYLVLDAQTTSPVAFTALQIAPGEQPLQHDGFDVAKPSAMEIYEMIEGPVRPAASLIVPVRLSEDARLAEHQISKSDGSFLEVGPIVEDPFRVIGHTVLVHTSVDNPTRALLYSTDAFFKMADFNTGELILFSGALEIHSLDGRSVAKSGDAGALVTMMDGSILGTVVAGKDTTCFLAPLCEVLSEFGDYKQPSLANVQSHNRTIEQTLTFGPERLARDSDKALNEAFDAQFAKHAYQSDVDEVTQSEAEQVSEAYF